MKKILILVIPIARSFHEKILSNLRFPYRSIREIFHAILPTRPYIFAQKFDLATPVKSDRKRKKKKEGVNLFHRDSNSRPLKSIPPVRKATKAWHENKPHPRWWRRWWKGQVEKARKSNGNVWAAIRGHTVCSIESGSDVARVATQRLRNGL